jgi:3-methyl-2-oxobutanoate hydroxymethyltransferase
MTEASLRRPLTVPMVRGRKRAKGAEPLVMVTAYDAPSARAADAAGVDLILVGDSVANTVLGYQDTLQVSVADLAHHVAAVTRVGPRALVVADLPWPSYHQGRRTAVRAAARLVRAGAKAVKLEGGAPRVPVVEALVDAEVPVMGHLGLTPQSVLPMGGYRVQGRGAEARERLVADALALEAAGVFAVVLEGVPPAAGRAVTEALDVPTIGIGAGPDCDGQVLVFHDLVGLNPGPAPRFARRYADLHGQATEAVAAFAADVREGRFPGPEETYPEEAPG